MKSYITTEVTSEQLALLFWQMPADEQAKFINTLGSIAGIKLRQRIQYIVISDELTQEGRQALQDISAHL